MGKIFKIWILSLVTGLLIYLVFTNRYIILSGTNIKYDRWTNETSQIKQPTEENKPWDKLGNTEKLEKLIELKESINKADGLRIAQLSSMRTAFGRQPTTDWSKYTGGQSKIDLGLLYFDYVYNDSLDKKIDSLFREALYLNKEFNNLEIIRTLSQFITKMRRDLKK